MLETFISTDWLKPLLKKLLALHGEQKQNIVKIADLFGDPELLAKYYVQPHCQHHNPADYDERETRSHIHRPAFDTINEFLSGDLQVRDGRSQMFILSDAGMGKTSLLMMLKLAHLTAFWPKSYDCLLLKLGADTMDTVKAVKERSNTVLLLDALDEDPLAWGKIKERLLELLTETNRFHRVLISCRTQFFPEKKRDPFDNAGRVAVGGFHCPMLFLSLFDEGQVQEYLQKKYPTRWYQFTPQLKRIEEKRQKAGGILEKMDSLRFRPLLLAHIEDLMDADSEHWDAYQIYTALVNTWLDREERKITALHKGTDKPLVSREDLLKACIKVAEFMQRQGKKSIEETELQALVADTDNNNIACLHDFDIGGRSLLNRNSDQAFRFSHYSIQEFLLAYGIAAGDRFLDPENPVRATDQLVFFLDLSGCPGMGLSHLQLQDFRLGDFFGSRQRKGRDMPGVNLAGSDLNGAYLEGANLEGANLEGANLEGANLEGANLEKAKLKNVCLHGVDLANVRLAGSQLTDNLRDGGEGPEMVLLSGGKFRMGDIQGTGYDDEKPVHEVSVSAFAIGRYPVMFEEYERFTEAAGREKPGDNGWGRGRRPVINVSWQEAAAYCEWLSEQTGQTYRLPTEAEWEYACRASAETAYCFGDDEGRLTEYAWYRDS
ncbi:MAG: SUMF1/EgtB/PvdO family nonheme iron enzyme [Gammaproteobacteria bacterium]|nr:SUMF1/EgtB/PvdO family nonheme iron enzyme [Gammaproteobacteria bacterium]